MIGATDELAAAHAPTSFMGGLAMLGKSMMAPPMGGMAPMPGMAPPMGGMAPMPGMAPMGGMGPFGALTGMMPGMAPPGAAGMAPPGGPPDAAELIPYPLPQMGGPEPAEAATNQLGVGVAASAAIGVLLGCIFFRKSGQAAEGDSDDDMESDDDSK